jgi:hypothetical protein
MPMSFILRPTSEEKQKVVDCYNDKRTAKYNAAGEVRFCTTICGSHSDQGRQIYEY